MPRVHLAGKQHLFETLAAVLDQADVNTRITAPVFREERGKQGIGSDDRQTEA